LGVLGSLLLLLGVLSDLEGVLDLCADLGVLGALSSAVLRGVFGVAGDNLVGEPVRAGEEAAVFSGDSKRSDFEAVLLVVKGAPLELEPRMAVRR
jgi:hypothetical protein